ncbi:hypothetical protein EV363DRAFT_956485 [Boletus edulis]|nr:hypothetical protein EV363DRAFT_1438049 [Boletus edulis]KAF8121147.1 hypothetical protein EV363DRAFT_956485 [Boletus edulis]
MIGTVLVLCFASYRPATLSCCFLQLGSGNENRLGASRVDPGMQGYSQSAGPWTNRIICPHQCASLLFEDVRKPNMLSPSPKRVPKRQSIQL